ncbi:sodium channel protein Nach [Penaeus vannamei]|uniref:sodium channel protein Nach n=1 Tax=Penaeus vannamei TaxID=6689 RepID=UPI00387F58C2
MFHSAEPLTVQIMEAFHRRDGSGYPFPTPKPPEKEKEKLGVPTVGHDPGVGKGRSSVYTSHKTHMLTFSHTQRPPTSSSISNLLEMICTKSTSHGLAHIWDNRRSAMGVLWFVVTAVCLVIGVVTCVFLVLQFMNREAQQEMRLKNADSLQIPSAVICNRRLFSRKKLESLGVGVSVSSLMVVMASTPYLGWKSNTTAEGRRHLQEAEAELSQLLEKNKTTFTELVERVSYSCEDVLIQCMVAMKSLPREECCQRFTKMPTMSGLCLAFFTTPNDKQILESDFMGLTFYVKVPEDDDPELDPRIISPGFMIRSGLYVTVMSPSMHPAALVTSEGSHLKPLTIASIRVTATKKKTESMRLTQADWDDNVCVDESKLDYVTRPEDYYNTKLNCKIAKIRDLFLNVCNCSMYGLSHYDDAQETTCTLSQGSHCYEAFESILRDNISKEIQSQSKWYHGLFRRMEWMDNT